MESTPSSIVVACDGSDHSLQAAEMAAELARDTGKPLKLLSVFSGTSLEQMIIRGVSAEKIDAEVEHYGRNVFDAVRGAISDIMTPTSEVLLKGDPAKQILEYLDNHLGDHLVMGRRGHSMVRSLTLGSVSEKVIRHALVPVTVVNA